jgi:hypothetical protein
MLYLRFAFTPLDIEIFLNNPYLALNLFRLEGKRIVTPEDKIEDTLFKTPPRLAGESQGGPTIILAHRPSPEQPRRRPEAPPIFRLFPKEPALPPASTAPPHLEEGGRGKRKRAHTDRYKDAVEQGDLDESQHGKAGRP